MNCLESLTKEILYFCCPSSKVAIPSGHYSRTRYLTLRGLRRGGHFTLGIKTMWRQTLVSRGTCLETDALPPGRGTASAMSTTKPSGRLKTMSASTRDYVRRFHAQISPVASAPDFLRFRFPCSRSPEHSLIIFRRTVLPLSHCRIRCWQHRIRNSGQPAYNAKSTG